MKTNHILDDIFKVFLYLTLHMLVCSITCSDKFLSTDSKAAEECLGNLIELMIIYAAV